MRLPPYPASHDTVIPSDTAMSYGVKLTLFLLAFNVIGFAEGYLLHELGAPVVSAYYSRHGFWSRAAESALVDAGESLIRSAPDY